MLVLAKLGGVQGDLDKSTGVFTPRAWTPEEEARYNSGRETDENISYEKMLVLAKLEGVQGDLDKSTGVFTPRAWTPEEEARYNSVRGI